MRCFLLAIVCTILFFSCSNVCRNCGCDNIDDCLSKNKFEEARKYASHEGSNIKSKALAQIIVSEVNYWVSVNDFIRAENCAKELLSLDVVMYDEENKLSEGSRNFSYIELMKTIIIQYINSGQLAKGEEISRILPKKILIKRESVSLGKSAYDSYILQENQEIEPFVDGLFYHKSYNVTTYVNAQEDALKVVGEYKKGK